MHQTNVPPHLSKRVRFRGTFQRYGWQPGKRGDEPMLLLDAVTAGKKQTELTAVWCQLTRSLWELGELKTGDVIQFTGRLVAVDKYQLAQHPGLPTCYQVRLPLQAQLVAPIDQLRRRPLPLDKLDIVALIISRGDAPSRAAFW
ncbi:hypothetical protein [Lactiplantibacillus daowaiensis]|uniref:Uncharacterized protein n=1 Tax=Lactiplantibacillus daowaiensis TaxID=2559918 RepID=A0ABW1S2J5_9LACO|nr:hypothetical protein [Lactiplantibacillus daowaiensis]